VPRALFSQAEVEEALAEVYARPELAAVPPSRLTAWLADVWNGLREWLAGVFPGLGLGAGGVQMLGWVVAGLFVLLAIAVLLHLTRSGTAWWQARDRSGASGGAAAADAGSLSAADWQARARMLAEAGRWRDAVLAQYQALVLVLDARGALRYDASKTPGDYRRELRGDPAMSRLFETFLRAFEPAAFGSRAADAAVFGHLQTLATEASPHG
jgi:hypothetical protein